MSAPGIAYSHARPQPEMARSYYIPDADKFSDAWHAAHCRVPDCDRCQSLCDTGAVISCDECGHVHHTDWLGWTGTETGDGGIIVLCPECETKSE